jgi:Tol biopolymer transport system component
MNDGDPYLLPDRTIYWATDDVSVGDIYRATWNGSGFRPHERQTGYDSAGTDLEASPLVSADELTMYLQSARAGGVGSFDIWMTTRTSTMAAWGAPVNLTILNSNNIDVPDWISADGCVLYMHRNVGAAGGPTNYDLFYAVRGM